MYSSGRALCRVVGKPYILDVDPFYSCYYQLQCGACHDQSKNYEKLHSSTISFDRFSAVTVLASGCDVLI